MHDLVNITVLQRSESTCTGRQVAGISSNSEAVSPSVRGEAFEPSSQIQSAGQSRLCACGRPVRPHTFFCGDDCRFDAKVATGPHCWEWTSNMAGGRTGKKYGQFSIAGPNGERIAIGAHVYAYIRAYGPVPDGLEVMHKCHNGRCVRPDHLQAGTHTENVRDSSEAGHLNVQRPKGWALTTQDVYDIRALVNTGMLRSHVAERYRISKAYVTRIMAGTARQYDAPLVAERQKAS